MCCWTCISSTTSQNPGPSALQEICSHEYLECDLGLDGELRDLRGAVGVARLEVEEHADLAQDVRGEP